MDHHSQRSVAKDSRVVDRFYRSPDSRNAEAVALLLDGRVENWEPEHKQLIVRALEGLRKFPQEVTRRQLVALVRADPGRQGAPLVITAACLALAALGGAGAFEELASVAAKKESSVVSGAAAALGALHDPRGVGILESLALSHEEETRYTALLALARDCNPSSRTAMEFNMTNSQGRSREGAVWWLSSCGDGSDAGRLVNLLSDPDDTVRGHALDGLIRMKEMDGCWALERLLDDRSVNVRAKAIRYSEVCSAAIPREE